MKIRDSNDFHHHSRFDASAAQDTMRELDEQYASGEIGRHAYVVKKQSLVRLFMKATTSPRPRERNSDER